MDVIETIKSLEMQIDVLTGQVGLLESQLENKQDNELTFDSIQIGNIKDLPFGVWHGTTPLEDENSVVTVGADSVKIKAKKIIIEHQ